MYLVSWATDQTATRKTPSESEMDDILLTMHRHAANLHENAVSAVQTLEEFAALAPVAHVQSLCIGLHYDAIPLDDAVDFVFSSHPNEFARFPLGVMSKLQDLCRTCIAEIRNMQQSVADMETCLNHARNLAAVTLQITTELLFDLLPPSDSGDETETETNSDQEQHTAKSTGLPETATLPFPVY